MKNLKGACLFGQSGGPTSVINASAAGVFIEALEQDLITDILGAEHGIRGILFNSSWAFFIVSLSSSFKPSNFFIYDILSFICSMLLIPDNTVITPSKSAANFIAHDA